MIRADHTRVQAQDRAAAVAAHIPVAAVDTHRTAAEDRHLVAAVEVHRPTAVEAVLHRTAEAAEVTASRNLPAIASLSKLMPQV